MPLRHALAAALGTLLVTASAAAHGRPSAAGIDQTEMRCMVWAARHYHRPSDPLSLQAFVDLLAAVRLTEGGRAGRVSWNRNGSYDIGPMQINSTHLAQLQRFGISYQALLLDPCQNIVVGAWILHANLASSRDLWTSIGNYNSHTTIHNQAYQRRIWQRLQLVWSRKVTRGALTATVPPAAAVASE